MSEFVSSLLSKESKYFSRQKCLESLSFHLLGIFNLSNKSKVYFLKLLWYAPFLTKNSINSKVVKKVKEGHPNIVDLIKDNEIDIVMNTTLTKMEVTESFSIRRTALTRQVPYFTTVAGAFAAVEAIEYLKNDSIRVKPLQEYF